MGDHIVGRKHFVILIRVMRNTRGYPPAFSVMGLFSDFAPSFRGRASHPRSNAEHNTGRSHHDRPGNMLLPRYYVCKFRGSHHDPRSNTGSRNRVPVGARGLTTTPRGK